MLESHILDGCRQASSSPVGTKTISELWTLNNIQTTKIGHSGHSKQKIRLKLKVFWSSKELTNVYYNSIIPFVFLNTKWSNIENLSLFLSWSKLETPITSKYLMYVWFLLVMSSLFHALTMIKTRPRFRNSVFLVRIMTWSLVLVLDNAEVFILFAFFWTALEGLTCWRIKLCHFVSPFVRSLEQ